MGLGALNSSLCSRLACMCVHPSHIYMLIYSLGVEEQGCGHRDYGSAHPRSCADTKKNEGTE